MSTMREHLKTVHTEAADFHTQAAKQHRALAKCFGSMGKAEGMESASDIEAAHLGLSEQHLCQAEFHVQCAKDLSSTTKAMGMDRDEIAPDQIFGYLPEILSHIRAVPRAGQREVFGKPSDGMDPALVKVIGFDEID